MSTASFPIVVLAFAPTFVASSPEDGNGSPPDEEAAREALERAESLHEKGQYERAHRAYFELAEDHPDTESGAIARRRSRANAFLGSVDLIRSGDSANRVDIVLMGDGFVLKKLDAFDKVASDLPRAFERDELFGEYFSYLNFLKATVVSEEDGIDGYNREASTALGARVIQAPDVDLSTVDAAAVEDVLDQMPENDGYAIALVPRADLGSGGLGVATIADRAPKAILHEWGHAFGSLREEFAVYTGYRGEKDSWINVSNTEDPAQVPWAHWIEAEVPGVGVYEGADGQVRDMWKPTASGCTMAGGERYCPVCREALILAIYEHVDPIDRISVLTSPEAVPGDELTGTEPHEIEVVPMMPKKHGLTFQAWVLPADQAPPDSGDPSARPRRRRGPLAPIEIEPTYEPRGGRKKAYTFEVDPDDLEPGRYKVVCRVTDETELRGEKHPWVLQDPHGLLSSERWYWVEVAP